MTEHNPGDLIPLLQSTVNRHIMAGADISPVRSEALTSGHSGAAVWRHQLVLQHENGQDTAFLITKRAHLRERLVLKVLQDQQQAVPFNHTENLENEQDWICLQDLGTTTRPTSLEPIDPTLLSNEVWGLASIHAANLGATEDLFFLPRVDQNYFQDMLNQVWWPHWQQALQHARFVETFRPWIEKAEQAAQNSAHDMAALCKEDQNLTLIHTDINPSNVLIHHQRAHFIDWADAHIGPLYLDLPHHLSSLKQAEVYRLALGMQRTLIEKEDFQERFRVAARYTALRYMWWTFEAFLEDSSMEVWVRHYLQMLDLRSDDPS